MSFPECKLPMISPRLDAKGYGIKRSIDGVFCKGNIAILIDDLITKADSKFSAISVLEENGLRVNDIVVLVDREQSGVRELGKRGYACHVAFKLRELLDIYLESGKISREQYNLNIKTIESDR
jgi:orotate phosphoribosyltransferase